MKLRGSLKAHNLCPQSFIVMCAVLLIVSGGNLEARVPRPHTTPPPQDSSIQAQTSANAKQLYSTAMDFLGEAFLGSDQKAHAVPGTVAAAIPKKVDT
jgi:hypothetical protein